MADHAETQVETAEDFGDDPGAEVRRWLAEIELYDKEYKNWVSRAKKIVKRYRDERSSADDETRRLNLLWSNIQTLTPALYGRTPKAEVVRRFKDRDPVGRTAAEVLERATNISIETDPSFDGLMKSVVQDRLLVGRGTAWLRYIPTFGPAQTGEDNEEFRPVIDEKAPAEYVFWQDFGHTPARRWPEVKVVWRRIFMSRAELVDRFKEIGKKVPLNHKPAKMSDDDSKAHGGVFRKAVVYEIWDKSDRKVHWVSPDFTERVLDVKDDFLHLQGFFPTPEPLYGTTTSDTLVPVPDYLEYQDQAKEIDELTGRISLLVSALRAAGVYDASAEGVQRLLDPSESMENKLIPVEAWAAFSDKGGLKGVIDWMPIKEIAEVLGGLIQARREAKDDLFEVSGLADIVRGQVDPREKLGQSEIKSQFATMRMGNSQADVARFARDIIRLKAEIIAEHFAPETISAMTGMPDFGKEPERPETPPGVGGETNGREAFETKKTEKARQFQAALELLRDDRLRSFRVDIETDSTIKLDEQEDKAARIEFLAAAGGFLQQAMPAAQQVPKIGALLGEMLLFGIRGFKAGRTLEASFEEAIEDLREAPAQPQDGEAQGRAEAQAKAASETARIEFDREKLQAEQSLKREEMQQRDSLERDKADLNAKLQREKMGLGDGLEREKIAAAQGPSILAAMERIQAQMTEHAQMNNAALAGAAQSLVTASQTLADVAAHLNAPKRIVRDEQGRPAGIESVTQ